MNAYFAFVFSGTIGGLLKAKDKYDCIIVSSPPLTVGITALILKFFKRLPFVLKFGTYGLSQQSIRVCSPIKQL